MEKYLREFLSTMIRLLLEGKGEQVHPFYGDFCERLERQQIAIALLAKTETLSESPESCLQKVKAKKRNRAAAYELALQSGRDFRAGDQVSYYGSGGVKVSQRYDSPS